MRVVRHPRMAQLRAGFLRAAARGRVHERVDPGYGAPVHDVRRGTRAARAITARTAAPARSRSLPRRGSAAHASRAYAPRSFASTGPVSGRTPRQRKNDSAACSTSMPRPSLARAPAPRAAARNGVSPAVDHVVGERPLAEHRRRSARRFVGQAGGGGVDDEVEGSAAQRFVAAAASAGEALGERLAPWPVRLAITTRWRPLRAARRPRLAPRRPRPSAGRALASRASRLLGQIAHQPDAIGVVAEHRSSSSSERIHRLRRRGRARLRGCRARMPRA